MAIAQKTMTLDIAVTVITAITGLVRLHSTISYLLSALSISVPPHHFLDPNLTEASLTFRGAEIRFISDVFKTLRHELSCNYLVTRLIWKLKTYRGKRYVD